jgi:hypothetical protein
VSDVPRGALRTVTHAVFTELADGTGVVLDLESKRYFSLNRTGTWLWQRVAETPQGRVDLGRALTTSFRVTAAQAEQDVGQFVEGLVARGLVTEDVA